MCLFVCFYWKLTTSGNTKTTNCLRGSLSLGLGRSSLGMQAVLRLQEMETAHVDLRGALMTLGHHSLIDHNLINLIDVVHGQRKHTEISISIRMFNGCLGYPSWTSSNIGT